MIGLAIFNMLALFGGTFMVLAFAKFHGELKRLKRTRQVRCVCGPDEWRVGRDMANRVEPGNNPERIVMIETPSCGPIPLVRTVGSARASSIESRNACRRSEGYLAQKEVLKFRKRPVG
jgi:hypothetical protein